jgi:hypothetical protein
MPMFCFQFEARPKKTHPKASEYGGAQINCWIQRDTQDEAESYARGSISDDGWTITHREKAFLVTKETQYPKGMRYFEQAEIDHEVFVLHSWPLNARDDGTPTV